MLMGLFYWLLCLTGEPLMLGFSSCGLILFYSYSDNTFSKGVRDWTLS